MKKIAKGLLIVWLLGAVGMTFYYAHERRSACIRDEGFWKGWLWCSSDPKSTFANSVQHAVDLVKGLAWPIKIFMREDGRAQAAGGPSWEVRGNEAAIILESKSNSGEAQFTILVIKYNKEAQCRAEVAKLYMVGKKLGAPTRQDRVSQSLLVAIKDGQSAEYRAVKTEYANGVEVAAVFDDDMISRMAKEQLITIGLKGQTDQTTFPLLNFQKANDQARARSTCAKKM